MSHYCSTGSHHFSLSCLQLIYCSCSSQGGLEPDSEFSLSSSSLNGSHLDTELENKLSIVHDNIQNFTNKQDILETELSCFDVICLTETWLDRSTENVDIELNGYIAYRRDRVGDSHGGVFVYVSKNFVSKQKDTLELPDIECV